MKNYHLCKEDYGEVKQRLSMRQVAEHYGCKVTRDGTCLCPFHNDTHPSMKIYPDDKGFYCWVCQKGGDVIKFVALLYGLKNEEACKRLIDDFSLPICMESLSFKEQRERQKQREREKELRRFQADAYSILKGYWLLLTESALDCMDWHFEEALQELPVVEYRLQCLRECPGEYFADREAVRRLGEIQGRIAGWYDRP